MIMEAEKGWGGQAGDPEEPMGQFQSDSKGLRKSREMIV